VTVPIWLTLTSRALADFSAMPRRIRSGLVTKMSSPTICTRSPQPRGQRLPASPVLLGQRVLNETIG
jgi:hypothetical protein